MIKAIWVKYRAIYVKETDGSARISRFARGSSVVNWLTCRCLHPLHHDWISVGYDGIRLHPGATSAKTGMLSVPTVRSDAAFPNMHIYALPKSATTAANAHAFFQNANAFFQKGVHFSWWGMTAYRNCINIHLLAYMQLIHSGAGWGAGRCR